MDKRTLLALLPLTLLACAAPEPDEEEGTSGDAIRSVDAGEVRRPPVPEGEILICTKEVDEPLGARVDGGRYLFELLQKEDDGWACRGRMIDTRNSAVIELGSVSCLECFW